MSTFAGIAQQGSATMAAMAPGVSAALITTVAGLLVAIPSMFGYNWLVHNFARVHRRAGQLRAGAGVEDGNGISRRRIIFHAPLFTTQFAGDVERHQHHAAAGSGVVLLIIFVITTPLLEKSIDLKLPHGGQTEKKTG